MPTGKKSKDILKYIGQQIIELAASSERHLQKATKLLHERDGGIILIGFGKSGAVCSKIASTFRSAGKKAFVLNPVDAFYGEAAAVSARDTAIIVSSGGESEEIIRIIPWLKKKEVAIIALTSSARSRLAKAADVAIPTTQPIDQEDALASYSSCIAALALGDLLALSFFYEQDIEHGRTHPSIIDAGEAMYAIEDLLSTRPSNPIVAWDTIFKDALMEITSKGLGAISVVGEDGKLMGIITDGDVRRLLQRSQGSLPGLFLTNVETVMTKNPRRITSSRTLTEALNLMEDNAITVLPVVNEEGAPLGMIHLHDLVQLGLLRRNSQTETKKPARQKKTVAKK